MNFLRTTIAMLFADHIEREEAKRRERERQRINIVLHQITDPAEAVGECLIDETTKTDHDPTERTRRAPIDRR